MAAGARILICSRRDDAAGYARLLRDRLGAELGEDQVAVDVDRLHAGAEFLDRIDEVIGSADVLLAVIGRDWLQATDQSGRRRLDDPDDYVRREIATALDRGLRVIPVLVGGAQMPSADELPDALQPLAWRKALEISAERFDFDAERLVRALAPIQGARQPPAAAPAPAPPPPLAPTPRPAEAPVTAMLRRAAQAGIVPAGPATRVVAPSPPLDVAVDRVKYPPRGRARRDGLPIGVVIGAPLVVLAVAAAAAKWLFGLFADVPAQPAAPADTVECTVFAPPVAAPGESILVQAFAHLPEHADDARAIAQELDTAARRRTFFGLQSPIRRGSTLHFELRMPGLEVDDPVASLVWRGRAEAVQFGVHVPPDTATRTVIGTVEVSLDGAPVGHVKFKLSVEADARSAPSEPQGEQARRYTAAFISYASEDRDKVLARVQMLSLQGIRYFQDVLSLEPGDRWMKKIELGIDECDVFLLFWSTEAKRSKWVREEVRYALARKSDDELSPPEIRPVIVEGPPIVEPWEELAHLHFNDRLLYFMSPPR
jgi:hypothetical protein